MERDQQKRDQKRQTENKSLVKVTAAQAEEHHLLAAPLEVGAGAAGQPKRPTGESEDPTFPAWNVAQQPRQILEWSTYLYRSYIDVYIYIYILLICTPVFSHRTCFFLVGGTIHIYTYTHMRGWGLEPGTCIYIYIYTYIHSVRVLNGPDGLLVRRLNPN